MNGYKLFVEFIENPLKGISKAEGFNTNPQYLQGTVRHEADKLKKGTGGRTLPAIMATYGTDDIVSQKQQPASHRLEKGSFELSNNRTVFIHGVVASFEDGDTPGDYLRDIELLLTDVKKALFAKDLKFLECGFILDNDDQTLGLAGFVLKITYKFIENFKYE